MMIWLLKPVIRSTDMKVRFYDVLDMQIQTWRVNPFARDAAEIDAC